MLQCPIKVKRVERGAGAQGVPKYFSGPLDMSPVSEIAPYIPSKSFVKFRCVHMRGLARFFQTEISVSAAWPLTKRPSGLKILPDMDTSALLPG